MLSHKLSNLILGCYILKVHITGVPSMLELSFGVVKSPQKSMNKASIVSDMEILYIIKYIYLNGGVTTFGSDYNKCKRRFI